MTRVWYRKDGDIPGGICERTLFVKGHAQYGKRGENILCAAISTLLYTLLYGLENQKKTDVSFWYRLDPGDAEVRVKTKSKKGENVVSALFSAVMTSFDKLEVQYGEHIKKEESEGEKVGKE